MAFGRDFSSPLDGHVWFQWALGTYVRPSTHCQKGALVSWRGETTVKEDFSYLPPLASQELDSST